MMIAWNTFIVMPYIMIVSPFFCIHCQLFMIALLSRHCTPFLEYHLILYVHW